MFLWGVLVQYTAYGFFRPEVYRRTLRTWSKPWQQSNRPKEPQNLRSRFLTCFHPKFFQKFPPRIHNLSRETNHFPSFLHFRFPGWRISSWGGGFQRLFRGITAFMLAVQMDSNFFRNSLMHCGQSNWPESILVIFSEISVLPQHWQFERCLEAFLRCCWCGDAIRNGNSRSRGSFHDRKPNTDNTFLTSGTCPFWKLNCRSYSYKKRPDCQEKYFSAFSAFSGLHRGGLRCLSRSCQFMAIISVIK